MTPHEWTMICDAVTDAMKVHTRPFVTPLTSSSDEEVHLEGTGSYVLFEGQRILVTCQHVREQGGIDYRFYDSKDVFKHPRKWVEDPSPSIDVAIALMPDSPWRATSHKAVPVLYERFALRHQIAEKEELLFFRGFSGENACYGFGVHQANGSGYTSQEKQVSSPNSYIFEILWEPTETVFTTSADEQTRSLIKAQDARGFSGALVWNTRYIERRRAGYAWTPECAVVTGLLRRWDSSTKTLLAWRVEHLRAWLENGAIKKLVGTA